MFKKIIIGLLTLCLIGIIFNYPSDASFFKRSKTTKKQSLEKKEENKILVAQIYASWCPGCKNIQPTLDQLLKEVSDINFVQLDVSTPSKAQESAKKAKELEITDFYRANKSKTSTVVIIVPTSGEIVSIFENNNDLDSYKEAIEQAKTKEKALYNPPT